MALPTAGKLTAAVLDRDGYTVQYVVRDEKVAAGETVLRWNGRDAEGTIVPDESYSFKIDLVSGGRRWAYFPAQHAQTGARSIPVRSYDPRTGVLAYELPFACRVHIQAGSAVIDAEGHPDGPVLKTIADRQPRTAGTVVEQWNGLDESGTIYVPDLPHFVMSIAASPLPDDSVITVGNRSTTFLDRVARRQGRSFISTSPTHAHHAGLQTLDDISPPLRLTPTRGSWASDRKSWVADSGDVRVLVRLEGSAAARFAKNSQAILVFLDGKQVSRQTSSSPSAAVSLPGSRVTAGIHTLTINWVGRGGPVAVNSLRLVGASSKISSR